ncbi:MAG: type II toxin-antitoxin system HigB family toxin [Aridibacter famidurans]|nr:type II toxin-antitoxin system HigB family toxin [Aridibacter famidurans]
MKVLGLQIIDRFCRAHTRARSSSDHWIENAKQADWGSLVDIRRTFRNCDKVGSCYVFNLGGNNFRLIAKINFRSSILVVQELLTHSEYDSDRWKAGCE